MNEKKLKILCRICDLYFNLKIGLVLSELLTCQRAVLEPLAYSGSINGKNLKMLA